MSDRRLYNRIRRYLVARADRVGTGDLDERSPLQLVIRGESLSARIYQRYNGTKVLALDLYVDEIDVHPRATKWVATRSGVMPFCSLQIDRRRHDGSARLLVYHTLIADTVTAEILDEIIHAMIDRARSARQRVAEIVEAIRQDELDAELAALLEEGTAELEAEYEESAEEESDEEYEYEEYEEEEDDGTSGGCGYVPEEVEVDAEYDEYEDDEAEPDGGVGGDQAAVLTGDQVIAQLDHMVGLGPVKEFVTDLQAIFELNRRRVRRGMPDIAPSPHLVFVGNPGTGKTTVARTIGVLYRSLGLLESGHVIEATHADLIAPYLGQTGHKTRAICEKALGGVLFIDEAYSIAGGHADAYGQEAITELLAFMEKHRGRIAVIFAGYPEEMETFIGSNPGLKGRIDEFVHFPDYSSDELMQIFENLAVEKHFTLTDAARDKVRALIAAMPRGRGFSNARAMRQLFTRVTFAHAHRHKTRRRTSIDVIDAPSIPDVTDGDVLVSEQVQPSSPTIGRRSHGGYL